MPSAGNIAPVAGGAKLCHLSGLRVTGSSFSGNLGHGLCTDCSVYDITIANSVFTDNAGTGIFLELLREGVGRW